MESDRNNGEGRALDVSGAAPKLPRAVVGIGASAGGLAALEQFFTHLPMDTGMSYVVVTHLDPGHRSMMPEILQRFTAMPVVRIRDGSKIKTNVVHVTPPGFFLSISGTTLSLYDIGRTKRPRMVIDRFLRDLADAQDSKAIAVILSGAGSDGTLGIRALKERLGTVLAQEPTSAEFAGMPRSAITSGVVDYVAPPGELPRLLADYSKHIVKIPPAHVPLPEESRLPLLRIFKLIRSRTGLDFTPYNRSTIHRRIRRRMGLHRMASIEEYTAYLETSPADIEVLARDLLTDGSRFFRDPGVWEVLRRDTIPGLLRSRPGEIRAWVPGCSTGEEAYSLAMLVTESRDAFKESSGLNLRIYATDVNPDAVEAAREGSYPFNIEADVAPERLERFFIKEDRNYRVRPHVRSTIIFSRHNLLEDPPFIRMDLISCRNLLTYFSLETQQAMIPLFHRALNPDGVLVLGAAESLPIGEDELFLADNPAQGIYRRQNPVAVETGQIASSSLPPGPG